MNNAYFQSTSYMYNPMMMTPYMDPKGQMFFCYPVYIDPTKIPKDMNGQNLMYFQPYMYQPNYGEQGFMQNPNEKK